MIIGVVFVNKRASARKLKMVSLNARVRELELTAIRAQMNPHFMYNCLNSIQNLIQKNKTDEAHSYISRYALLLRQVLKNCDKEEIALSEELEMIRNYVLLEQLRFNIEFNIHISPEIDIYSVFVPPLLLQPLVENAIIHGLANKSSNRALSMEVNLCDKKICIQITDNGIGREASRALSKSTTGKGLKFSKERMALVSEKYGSNFDLKIIDLKDDLSNPVGTSVEICFYDEN